MILPVQPHAVIPDDLPRFSWYGDWLRENGHIPWRRGKPFEIRLEHILDNRFRLVG